MKRRELLSGTALVGAGLLARSTSFAALADAVSPAVRSHSLMGNRFVTFCIMIRTTPWEVSRDVKLLDRDESTWHTLDGVVSAKSNTAKPK